MIAAVTGAAGFVGRNLIPVLVRNGRQVRALVQRPVPSELIGEDRCRGERVEQITADVLKPGQLARAFRGVEVVYHLAARISTSGDPGGLVQRTNVEGTRNVVAACRQAGVRRLVHFSSIHALDPYPISAVVDESRGLYDAPGTYPYERSKAQAEGIVLAAVAEGLDAIIISPTGLLGPHDYDPTPQGRGIVKIMQGQIPAVVAGGFDFVDVRDVVTAALNAEMRGRRGERYLLSGEWISLHALASLLSRAAKVSAPMNLPSWATRPLALCGDAYSWATGRPVEFASESVSSLIRYRNVRRTKAERELGFRPRSLPETVADTVDWFAARGALRKHRRRCVQWLNV